VTRRIGAEFTSAWRPIPALRENAAVMLPSRLAGAVPTVEMEFL